jgi:hypothetical protein
MFGRLKETRMSFQMQSKQINAGDSQAFIFPSQVGIYVYGISGFELSAGNDPSKLTTASIKLSATQSSDYKTITVEAMLSIINDSTATNWVEVTVLAWLGSGTPPGIFLSNKTGIGPGKGAETVGIDNPPIVGAAMLSGFDLSFNNGSSELLGLGAAVGCTSSPISTTDVFPVGEGLLIGTKNNPSSNTVDAGMLILTQAQENVLVGMCADNNQTYEQSPLGTNSCSVTTLQTSSGVTTGLVPTQVAIFLQAFYLQYQISSFFNPTPDITYATVGASGITLNNTGFSFTSIRMLYDNDYYAENDGYDIAVAAPSLAASYLYIALAEPSASSVSPTSGGTGGGTQVTITGENFTDGAVVYFGNTEATSVQVASTTQLTATVPPAVSAGSVDVSVATAAGLSQSLSFEYNLATPTVTEVTPNYGSTSGGTVVTIKGSGFASDEQLAITEVKFGSVAATDLSYDSDNQTLQATSPSTTISGEVDVVVTNSQGSSATNYNDMFTYSTASDVVVVVVEKDEEKL